MHMRAIAHCCPNACTASAWLRNSKQAKTSCVTCSFLASALHAQHEHLEECIKERCAVVAARHCCGVELAQAWRLRKDLRLHILQNKAWRFAFELVA